MLVGYASNVNRKLTEMLNGSVPLNAAQEGDEALVVGLHAPLTHWYV